MITYIETDQSLNNYNHDIADSCFLNNYDNNYNIILVVSFFTLHLSVVVSLILIINNV